MDIGVGYGWRAVLKFAEFGDPLRFEQIYARREDLAKLDEGRSQLLKYAPHPRVGLKVRQFIRVFPEQRPSGAFQRVGHSHPPHNVAETIADQN